jgi:transposase InsO family protein
MHWLYRTDPRPKGFEVQGKKDPCGKVGCSVCTQGKLQRTVYREYINDGKDPEPLNLIHMDIMGKMDVRGIHHGKYLLTLTDDATNYVWCYPLKKKSHAEIKIKDWFVRKERKYPEYTIKVFRSDNGGEFISNSFRGWLTTKGIQHDLACDYSPQQNGKAERMNRTLSEMARCMIIGSGLPKKYWEYAFDYAAWIQNRMVTKANKRHTAFELLTGGVPSLLKAKTFGCMAQVLIPEKKRKRKSGTKLDSKARWAVFLGPAKEHHGWAFHFMDTSTIGFSRDVVFHEDVPYGLWRSWPKEPRSLAAQSPLSCIPEDVPMQEASTDKDVADEDDDIVEVTTTAGPAASVSDDVEDDNEGDEDDELIDPRRQRTAPDFFTPSSNSAEAVEAEEEGGAPSDIDARWASFTNTFYSTAPPGVEPASLGKEWVYDLGDEEWVLTTLGEQEPLEAESSRAQAVTLPDISELPQPPDLHPEDYEEPKTVQGVLRDVYSKPWVESLLKEYNQVKDKGVWEWRHLPPGTKTMGTKWVFKRKVKVDGSLDKFKSRLCVQGYDSIEGVHHFETYSPTASAAAARSLLALACARGWKVEQMDVSGAFLYGDLEEEIYCRPPPGFEDPEGRVWRLKKSLYGLKQAPRVWIKTLADTLKKAGFVQSQTEPSLFHLKQGKDVIYVLVFVDDLLLTSGSDELINFTKETLHANFEMTDLGPAK